VLVFQAPKDVGGRKLVEAAKVALGRRVVGELLYAAVCGQRE
jgi:hypothetical protein